MSEVIKVKAAGVFPLISELLANGQDARITVSGNSMFPFLRDGIDSVELRKGSFETLSRGDIVMIQRADEAYVMHRVIRKEKDCFFMLGDAQQWIEGPLYPEQIVAVVPAVWRKEKRISCKDFWWRTLTGLWLHLRPLRRLILKVIRGVHK